MKIDKFWKKVLINVGLSFGVPALFALFNMDMSALLILPVVIAAFQILIGIILLIPDSTRDTALSMLLASGIILLVGFSICSAYPLNFH